MCLETSIYFLFTVVILLPFAVCDQSIECKCLHPIETEPCCIPRSLPDGSVWQYNLPTPCHLFHNCNWKRVIVMFLRFYYYIKRVYFFLGQSVGGTRHFCICLCMCLWIMDVYSLEKKLWWYCVLIGATTTIACGMFICIYSINKHFTVHLMIRFLCHIMYSITVQSGQWFSWDSSHFTSLLIKNC